MESDKFLEYNMIVYVKVRFSVKAFKRPKQVGDFFFQIVWLSQKRWKFSIFQLKIDRLKNYFYPTRIGNFRAKKPENEIKKAVFIVL